jgi:hypothetical protein
MRGRRKVAPYKQTVCYITTRSGQTFDRILTETVLGLTPWSKALCMMICTVMKGIQIFYGTAFIYTYAMHIHI